MTRTLNMEKTREASREKAARERTDLTKLEQDLRAMREANYADRRIGEEPRWSEEALSELEHKIRSIYQQFQINKS